MLFNRFLVFLCVPSHRLSQRLKGREWVASLLLTASSIPKCVIFSSIPTCRTWVALGWTFEWLNSLNLLPTCARPVGFLPTVAILCDSLTTTAFGPTYSGMPLRHRERRGSLFFPNRSCRQTLVRVAPSCRFRSSFQSRQQGRSTRPLQQIQGAPLRHRGRLQVSSGSFWHRCARRGEHREPTDAFDVNALGWIPGWRGEEEGEGGRRAPVMARCPMVPPSVPDVYQ